MSKYSRKHHYIPVFYLSGFTPSYNNKDKLWCTDLTTGNQWQAKPKNVAYECDLYKIILQGVQPDVIEKGLADFESKAAPVIRNLIQTPAVPTDDDYKIFIELIALMTVRVSRVKNLISEIVGRFSQKSMEQVLSSREQYESMLQQMHEKGGNLPNSSYEEMKQFFESDDYTIEIDQNWYIKFLFEKLIILFFELHLQRTWSFYIPHPSAGHFVCSDNPVTLTSNVELPKNTGPGFGMQNTESGVPISKSLATNGCFGGSPRIQIVSPEFVARFNHRTLSQAVRFIFSSNQEFFCLGDNGDVMRFSDWLRHRFPDQAN